MAASRRPDAPFSTPGPSAEDVFWWLLLASCIGFAGYNAWVWLNARDEPARAVPSRPTEMQRDVPRERIGVPNSTPGSAPSIAAPTVRQVTRCTRNEQTVYTDGECPLGFRSEQVAIRPDENVADGLRSQTGKSPEQIINAPSYTAPRSISPIENPGLKALCSALDEEIKRIDVAARQALPPQEQDRLAAERKQARDEQFRSHCH